jgi:hypothetical protein
MHEFIKKQPPLPQIDKLDFQAPTFQIGEFLILSLPMSKDIETLFSIYINDFKRFTDKESLECAFHDAVLYKIPFGLNKNKFLHKQKIQIFKSKFIQNLLTFIDEKDRYFGQVKEWIQKNCHDVPVSSRRDLTGNIQVLFKWIVELSEGRYLSDKPNYSQRIYRARINHE